MQMNFESLLNSHALNKNILDIINKSLEHIFEDHKEYCAVLLQINHDKSIEFCKFHNELSIFSQLIAGVYKGKSGFTPIICRIAAEYKSEIF